MHSPALEVDRCGSDPCQQARPQEEPPFETSRSFVMVGVDPYFVEVVDEEGPDVDPPGIARLRRELLLGRPQRRVDETRNRREHGDLRGPGLCGLELVAKEEGETSPAKALRAKCPLDEREDRVVDAGIRQADDPLDVPVATPDPQVLDRDAAWPERCCLVVVEGERLGVGVDERSEPGAREQPVGCGRVHSQSQERSERQQPEQAPGDSSPGQELFAQGAPKPT